MFQAPTKSRPVDAPLSDEQEERLSRIVEALSESGGPAGQKAFERATAEHPDLAAELKELWAAMLLTDAVAEHSTILQAADGTGRDAGADHAPVVFRPSTDPSIDAAFVPGASPLPAVFGMVLKTWKLRVSGSPPQPASMRCWRSTEISTAS